MNALTGVIVLLLFLVAEGTIKNNRPPIIGILSQELSVSIKERFPEYKSFIAASYVKSVEAAGARVVPILIGQNDSYYR